MGPGSEIMQADYAALSRAVWWFGTTAGAAQTLLPDPVEPGDLVAQTKAHGCPKLKVVRRDHDGRARCRGCVLQFSDEQSVEDARRDNGHHERDAQ